MMTEILKPNKEKAYTVLFSLADNYKIFKPHANPLAMIALVSSFIIARMMVDTWSFVDILFWDAFQKWELAKTD